MVAETKMGQAHSQTTQREQMKGVDQGECINVQGGTEPGLRTMVCRWGDWCLFVDQCKHHELSLDERASLVEAQFTLVL
jgi:hypothetical protein